MTEPIEDAYLERCRNIATEIKKVLGARRTLFLSMIGEYGAVETTKRLVHAEQPSDTFVDLMVKGRPRSDRGMAYCERTEVGSPLYRRNPHGCAQQIGYTT